MKLRRVEITSIGNSWTLQWDTGFYVHIGDVNSFAKLLRKLKAADNQTDPKSHRSLKYLDMAKEVTDGDNIIWIWDHILKTIKEEKMRTEKKNDFLKIEKNFRLPGTDVILEEGDEIKILTDASKTAKCPTCNKKYLIQTGYCVSCKKKVADPKKESHFQELYTVKYTDKSQRDVSGKSLAYIKGPGLHSLKKIKGTDDYEIYDIDDKLIGKAIKESSLSEKVDAKKVIKDLAKSYGDSNEEQGKMVALLKGLAFSDDAEANKFMQALDKWTTTYANKMKD